MSQPQFEQRPSGLIAPVPPAEETVSVPDHVDAKNAIRDNLQWLERHLAAFEQTTHGRVSQGTIEEVAQALVACYNNPTSFTISDLAQHIQQLK